MPALGSLARRVRRALSGWLLRRRRARAGRRKAGSRKLVVALALSFVALLALFAAALAYLRPPESGRELTLDELSGLADDGRLLTARFLDADATITGTFSASDGTARRYFLTYPSSDAVTAFLVETTTGAGATVSIDPQPAKDVVATVSTFLLPLMILANLFALLFSASRGGSSGIGEVMTFGTIGNKRRRGSAAPVTFDQVAGADEAVAELREVVDYLKAPARYEEVGALPPKGVLLFGPPGCGKTLLAKAVAGEAGVPFFSVAGAEFVESLVGVGAARVRDLFQRVRAVAPAIVFIDELDAAGRKRAAGGGSGGADEREQTLNQLLVEMDGFELSAGIVVVGATNRPDILDPALLRPGRFDRHVTVEQPDLHGRLEILELHAAGKPVSPLADLAVVARRTPGFSGADLANVLNEAALLTVREGKPEIEMSELEEAVQRVLAGPKKKGRVLSPEERKRAAFHESGHAIVAAASGRLDEVHRVSILARGRSLGSASLQRDDSALQTRSALVAGIVVALGGIAAEVLLFGEPSTGAEDDLQFATDQAFDVVGRFGMGERRRRLVTRAEDEFLGETASVANVSALTHQEMEAEVDRLLARAEEEATALLTRHRDVLAGLAERLEAEETIEGPDLESVLALVRPEVTLFGDLLAERRDAAPAAPVGAEGA
ncbi:MAG TPA: ATP-dependent zinc metalloprotease FtsH [Actinomycetota bacterium]|nr:ATP-dependent zinc metalloprotease FtsH [Actinomycetota bacterium]